MAGFADTGNLQEALQMLRLFLGFVFIVGWIASTVLFWFLIFDFLALGKRKVVEVEVDGVTVPVPCKKEMVSLCPLFLYRPVFFLLLVLLPLYDLRLRGGLLDCDSR
jgi:hypothetical protein